MLTYNYFVTEPFFTGAPSPQREHRISEDLQWKRTLFGSKNSLTNRVRMEQRFLVPTSPNRNADSWHFAQRLRYRLTADFSLPWKDAAPWPDYVWLYDEPFVNIGPHQTSGILAQNLSTGGLGWNLSSHAQLEVGYMLQYTPSPAGMTGAFNHILLVTLLSDHPFTRRK